MSDEASRSLPMSSRSTKSSALSNVDDDDAPGCEKGGNDVTRSCAGWIIATGDVGKLLIFNLCRVNMVVKDRMRGVRRTETLEDHTHSMVGRPLSNVELRNIFGNLVLALA